MRLVRWAAEKISDFVVVYSSAGCKDWAEGLSAEAESIESDWAALGWALGSTRVLLDRREAPIGSLAELPAVAQKHLEQRLTATANYWYQFVQAALFSHRYFFDHNRTEHLGCGLVMVCSLCMGIYSLLEWRRLDALRTSDVEDFSDFYKTELVRARDRYHSPRWYAFFAFLGVYLAGFLLSSFRTGGHPFAYPIIALLLFSIVVTPFALQTRRNQLMQLERLEALLAEKT